MAHQTFFKHDMVPASVERHARKRTAEKALEDAYKVVDRRDGGRCRVTGRTTQSGAVSPEVRREHHHLRTRSTHPELVADPDNIVTVCAAAHVLFKAGWLLSEGTNASKAVRFHWAAHVPVDKRPFRIASRRRSQQVA